MRREYFAPCTLGLEPALAWEVEGLGAEAIREQKGGVAFAGDLELGYRANLWLRTAIRVQEKLFQGRCRDDRDLYELCRRIDWAELMSLETTFAIDATVRDSGITHSKYAALRCKDAICDQFRDATGERPSVDTTAPDLPIKVAVIRNTATIYRNLSGTSLHKRGWRPIQVKSPLNESIAAGLLILSGWDQQSNLVDPMCGSGTFLIEAACMASGRAPGRLRMFAFETWPDFDEDLWETLRREARAGELDELDFCIEGADRHSGALQLAKKSAHAADVGPFIRYQHCSARDFVPAAPPAQVVVNPPYGQRLGEGQDLLDSWDELSTFLHTHCRGAHAHVLSGNKDLSRHLGLRAASRTPVRNGPIDCRWLGYEIRAERAPRAGSSGDE